MKNIIVLAGGESVKDFDYRWIDQYGCYVIGVNDAFRYAPVDCVVSMDRKFLEGRWDELKEFKGGVYLRENAYRVNKKPETFPNLHIFECNHETDHFAADSSMTLNGRSSGHCAINLAYRLRPKNLYLFGFDMQGGHWWQPYPWAKEKLGVRSNEWIQAFETIKPYFTAIECNTFIVGDSAVQNWNKLPFEQFIEARKNA